jgi:DNA-directed RNA polymerase subunit RPC12/RpoP
MENGIAVKAEIVCSEERATRKEGSQVFGADFNILETYEESFDCPYCGEKILFRVKTKGDVTEETKKASTEYAKAARLSLIIIVSSLVAIFAVILLKAFVGGDLVDIAGNVVILMAAFLLIAGLLYFAAYARYLGNNEKAIIKYESKHPYMVSIIGSGHYFKESVSHRGKSIKNSFITWDEHGIRQ